MDKEKIVEAASFVELPQVIDSLGEGQFTVVVRGQSPTGVALRNICMTTRWLPCRM